MPRPVMAGLLVAMIVAAAACGTTTDDRPATLEYVTAAILAPSCANAQCHSSFKQADGYVFDTVETACKTMTTDSQLVKPGNPDESTLVIVLERTVDRMPFDQPLPTVDIELIRTWIAEGAQGLPETAEECR